MKANPVHPALIASLSGALSLMIVTAGNARAAAASPSNKISFTESWSDKLGTCERMDPADPSAGWSCADSSRSDSITISATIALPGTSFINTLANDTRFHLDLGGFSTDHTLMDDIHYNAGKSTSVTFKETADTEDKNGNPLTIAVDTVKLSWTATKLTVTVSGKFDPSMGSAIVANHYDGNSSTPATASLDSTSGHVSIGTTSVAFDSVAVTGKITTTTKQNKDQSDYKISTIALKGSGTAAATGGGGGGTKTASGTYIWNATTSTISFHTISSTFTCSGPKLGTSTKSGVTIAVTTMTWSGDDIMTWTRSSGTAGSIVGTWTTSDSSGNSFTGTFNANGTFSLTGIIVSCGESAKAEAQHWASGYIVSLRYSDPSKAATAVSVTGPGITGSVSLIYNTHVGIGSWGSGTPESIISLGAADPTGLPFIYTFTITDATGTWTTNSTVACYPEQFPTNLSPAGTVTGTPTFSWSGINDPSPVYAVEVNDSNGDKVWSSFFISGTSIVYSGPALTPGMTYEYVVSVQSSSTCNNPTSGGGSYVVGSFMYTGGGTNTGTGTKTASGTYALNSTTHVLTLNWTSTTFTCQGPHLGANTQTNVTITTTTMTWADAGTMTWTRLSGTAGKIVGTWTSSDSSGNSWTATFNTKGAVSVTGIIVLCGDDNHGESNSGSSGAIAGAQHWSDGYIVSLGYSDSSKAVTAVSVAGPGITGTTALTYNTVESTWGSGNPGSIISFGTTYPTGLPLTYTFTITDPTGTWTTNSTASCFQEQFPTNISPSGTVTGTPMFSWTGINDPNARYAVELNDNNGNPVWHNHGITGTSIGYTGPALTPGTTYEYDVSIESSTACNNGSSFVTGGFTCHQ